MLNCWKEGYNPNENILIEFFCYREDEEVGDVELLERGLQSHTGNDSPLSVDSLSGIYLGFSEKEKKVEEEKEGGEEEESSYIIEDDLKIEEEEEETSECLLKRPQSEKTSRPHLPFAPFFRPKKKKRSKSRIVETDEECEEEKEEATSCFRLFRRTLNITECDV